MSLLPLASGMMFKFFDFPNCIQLSQYETGVDFSDICTLYHQNNDVALTTCHIDAKGNGTIVASFFAPGPEYSKPVCNTSVLTTLTAPGLGVCVNLPQGSYFSAASFMFGDPSEKMQCASSIDQGAVLVSYPLSAKECDALPYTLADSVPITTSDGCYLPTDGSSGFSVRAYYLNKKKNSISLTYFYNLACSNTSIMSSWPSLPLDGSCHNSTYGVPNGALPCNPYPPKKTIINE